MVEEAAREIEYLEGKVERQQAEFECRLLRSETELAVLSMEPSIDLEDEQFDYHDKVFTEVRISDNSRHVIISLEIVMFQDREVQVEADLRLRSQREAGVQRDTRDRAPDPSVLRRSYYDSVKFYRAVVRRREDRLSQAETCWRWVLVTTQ